MDESLDEVILKQMDSTVEMKLNRLLSKGLDVTSAIKLYKHDLQIEKFEDEYFAEINDNPVLRRTINSSRNSPENNHKSTNESLAIRLKQTVKVYNKRSGSVSILATILSEDEFSIAIVTPLMRRNHALNPRAAQIVYVLSSEKTSKQSWIVHQILTESEAGGIPLGLLITRNNSQFSLTQALTQYKRLIGDTGHYGCADDGPLVWVGEEFGHMEAAWREVYPSSLHVVSVCHIARTAWQKISLGKPEATQWERRILMSRLKRLLLSRDDKELASQFTQMTSDPSVKRFPQFVNYLLNLYEIRTRWCLCFRPSLISNETDPNPFQLYLETITSVVYDRLSELSLIQVIRFAFERLDKYSRQRIVDFLTGDEKRLNWNRFVHDGETIGKARIESIGLDEYLVCDDVDNEWYHVDVSIGTCQCPGGIAGAPCRHQYAVVKWFEMDAFGRSTARSDEGEKTLRRIIDCQRLD